MSIGIVMRKDLNIPADLGSLRLVEKAIDELSVELDLSDEVYGNVWNQPKCYS